MSKYIISKSYIGYSYCIHRVTSETDYYFFTKESGSVRKGGDFHVAENKKSAILWMCTNSAKTAQYLRSVAEEVENTDYEKLFDKYSDGE